jgi:hypothetical protein
VIFLRDKPFLLKKILDNPSRFNIDSGQADLIRKNWSLFDNLPRVRIDDANILSMRIRNTLYNSPNLLRFNFHSPAGAADFDRNLSARNPVRLPSHMRRWGGQEHFITTQYYPITPDSDATQDIDMVDWSQATKGVCTAWHAFNYRMGDATLMLRGDAPALTLGLNVQFSFGGGNQLVGHVDSIVTNFAVQPNGLEETVMTVTLSRVVMVDPETGDLDFLPMGSFGSLETEQKPTPLAPLSSPDNIFK